MTEEQNMANDVDVTPIPKPLKLCMYYLTMYNLSPIQQGIQCLHATVEYQIRYGLDELYKDWALMHKTVVILNGGTSNDGMYTCYGEEPKIGTMQEHEELLDANHIKYSTFKEPDCNGAMTAIAFLVDEKVFNNDLYPYIDTFFEPQMIHIKKDYIQLFKNGPVDMDLVQSRYPELFTIWVESVGGNRNAFLKWFLRQFKKA